MNKDYPWLSLIISLPTANATARMRIWRALKSLGCGVLRDGVYLLPANENTARQLAYQENEAAQAGGVAHIVRLASIDTNQERSFRALFDRTEDYIALKYKIDAFTESNFSADLSVSQRTLKKLHKEFAEITGIDYFPGQAREQIALMLEGATSALAAIIFPDEPKTTQGKIKKLNIKSFQKRTWATRKNMWVDRMASAWLIKRFIDPDAKFKWLNSPQECPKNALGFDFDGATFTHVESLVTFEVLLASFVHQPDPALSRIASVVHFLDAGGIPVAEARGMELILRGSRERCSSDNELLEETCRIFDDLYLTYTKEEDMYEL